MQIEVLKSKQQELFSYLAKFKEFYLVGGTALALQIGHRFSIDFDLFSENDITPALLAKIKRVFNLYKVKILLRHSEQLTVEVDGVRMDFVKYKFPLVQNTIEFRGVRMVKPAEIATMKAFALNFRGTNKDYIDLYFVLKEKYASLEQIEKIGDKKYKDEFNFKLFLQQLLILEELKEQDIEYLKKEPSKEEMKKLFEKEISKIEILKK